MFKVNNTETQESIKTDDRKLDHIEAKEIHELYKGIRIQTHLNLLVIMKHFTTLIHVYFSTNNCYVRNLAQPKFGCSIWNILRQSN